MKNGITFDVLYIWTLASSKNRSVLNRIKYMPRILWEGRIFQYVTLKAQSGLRIFHAFYYVYSVFWTLSWVTNHPFPKKRWSLLGHTFSIVFVTGMTDVHLLFFLLTICPGPVSFIVTGTEPIDNIEGRGVKVWEYGQVWAKLTRQGASDSESTRGHMQ